VSGTAQVTVTEAPVLTTITVSPSSASVQTGETQQFTATGYDQYDQEISIPSLQWSAQGDGSIDTSGLFTAGATAGSATVTATDTSSGTVSAPATVTVTEATPPPTANFSATPTTGDAPLAVAFTDLSTSSPTSWSWTFGDGGTSTAQNPSHTYAAAGTYTVSLTVTNAGGSDTATKTDYITVSTPSSGSFSLSIDPVSQSITRGDTATYTVTIQRSGGFTGAVTLSVSGAPSKSTVTFSPNPAAGGSSILTIDTGRGTSWQTYDLTITGVSGSVSNQVHATLIVNK
jgi:PKD repeat protein